MDLQTASNELQSGSVNLDEIQWFNFGRSSWVFSQSVLITLSQFQWDSVNFSQFESAENVRIYLELEGAETTPDDLQASVGICIQVAMMQVSGEHWR